MKKSMQKLLDQATRIILELAVISLIILSFCLYNHILVVETIETCTVRLVNADIATECRNDGVAIRWNS